jgi:hypothetical protein
MIREENGGVKWGKNIQKYEKDRKEVLFDIHCHV